MTEETELAEYVVAMVSESDQRRREALGIQLTAFVKQTTTRAIADAVRDEKLRFSEKIGDIASAYYDTSLAHDQVHSKVAWQLGILLGTLRVDLRTV